MHLPLERPRLGVTGNAGVVKQRGYSIRADHD